jgi:hypothetical protein
MGDHHVQNSLQPKNKSHLMKKPTTPYYSSNLGISKATKPFEVFLRTNWQVVVGSKKTNNTHQNYLDHCSIDPTHKNKNNLNPWFFGGGN